MMLMQAMEITNVAESELPEAFVVLQELRDSLDFSTFSARLRRQSKNGYCLYGAYQGGVLVGLIGMRPVETMARGKHLHVDDLVVTANRRGEGIGVMLLAFAEQHARNNEMTSVFLDSRQEVIGFYEELGYSPHTATLMRKKLQ
jgi:GNAT superfamily N-acetyltransferase